MKTFFKRLFNAKSYTRVANKNTESPWYVFIPPATKIFMKIEGEPTVDTGER